MKKAWIYTFSIFVLGLFLSSTSNVWAQGYSGLSKDKEEHYMNEINQMTQKVLEYESKVESLEQQKRDMENKFEQAMQQRDQLYRINISRKLESEIIKERLKYLNQAYKKIIKRKDDILAHEREFVQSVREEWLFQMLEGAQANMKKETIRQNHQQRLNQLKQSLEKMVDNSVQTEEYLTRLSHLYRNNKKRYLKRTSVDEGFMGSLEDNLEGKKQLIQDLRDSVARDAIK